MARHRRKLPPDQRPNWRDPNMPVTRDYKFADGREVSTVDPEYERRFREHLLSINPNPDVKDDPTYDLKKQRKRL